MSVFAYFAYVFLRFFSSPITLVQLPLYIFGFAWGALIGDFFGSKTPENSLSFLGLLTHDGPGGYLVNSTSGMPFIDFVIDFILVFIWCHIHGVVISPIAILASLEFIFTVIFAKSVLK